MAKLLKCRFHTSEFNINNVAFCEALAKECDKALFYLHPADSAEREHIHGLLWNCKLTEKAVRERAYSYYKTPPGNGSASCGKTYKNKKTGKECPINELTYSGYISYMSKGKYDPICNKGFETNEIQILKQNFKPEVVEVVTVEPIVKVKKLTQFQIAREAQIVYMEQYQSDSFNEKKLIPIVTRLLKENRICRAKLTVRNIIQDIQCELDEEHFMNSVLKMI